ncbi:MAG TPA: hypothetical protein VIY52_04155 [Streptosporangiaceae bacterium]
MIADIILVIAAALFIGVYVSWRAGRIDRLHARVETARAALDVTLLRRSSVALELATSGLLDPATSLLLAAAVHGTRAGGAGPAAAGGKASSVVPPGHALAGGSGGVVPPGQQSGDRPRDLAESDLTRALQAAFSQPDFRSSMSGKEGADELLAEVEETTHQVFLARKFYNNVVALTRDARRRPLARLLRLSGSAPTPVFFEMDDSLIADKQGATLAPPIG